MTAVTLQSLCFGVAGVYYTYRLGKHLGSGWVGVVAAAFLALTPMWVGYKLSAFTLSGALAGLAGYLWGALGGK